MKAKSKYITGQIQFYRKHIRTVVRDHLYSKMIAWSIAHLILPGFKIEVDENLKIVPYNKLFPPKADQWDAQVEKIAKWLSREPSKNITKDSMEAHFFVYNTKYQKEDKWKERWSATCYVYISSTNSESCEIEMVKEVVEKPKLTGYCAALATKKYLQTA
jgi:hypothetical protein